MALGGTFTWTDGQGGYLDLVGQISSLRNHYKDSYGDTSLQKGWRPALSIEGGKPMARLGGWQVEPQAQLTYMHTRYSGFDDATSHIDGYGAGVLHGRLGTRVFIDLDATGESSRGMNSGNGPQAAGTHLYGLVNVLHGFTSPESVNVGNTQVSERYSRTQSEVGLGFQHRWTKNVYAYADVRYQQSLDSNEAHATQATIGVRVPF